MQEEVRGGREETQRAFGTIPVVTRPTIPVPRQTHINVTLIAVENDDMVVPSGLPSVSAGCFHPQVALFSAPYGVAEP